MIAVKPTIFVVEDDPDISRLVRHHLEGAGFNLRLVSESKTNMPDDHIVGFDAEKTAGDANAMNVATCRALRPRNNVSCTLR